MHAVACPAVFLLPALPCGRRPHPTCCPANLHPNHLLQFARVQTVPLYLRRLNFIPFGSVCWTPGSYVKDNFPGLQLTVSDLSPFYLAEARSNIDVRSAELLGLLGLLEGMDCWRAGGLGWCLCCRTGLGSPAACLVRCLMLPAVAPPTQPECNAVLEAHAGARGAAGRRGRHRRRLPAGMRCCRGDSASLHMPFCMHAMAASPLQGEGATNRVQQPARASGLPAAPRTRADRGGEAGCARQLAGHCVRLLVHAAVLLAAAGCLSCGPGWPRCMPPGRAPAPAAPPLPSSAAVPRTPPTPATHLAPC